MYCGKCGTENSENASFCVNCGEQIKSNSQPQFQTQPQNVTQPENLDHQTSPASRFKAILGKIPMPTSQRNKLIGVITVGAIALIIVIVLLIVLFSGRGYEETAEDYVDAMFTGDVEEIVDLLPEDLIARIAYVEDMSEQECYAELQSEIIDEVVDITNEFGNDWDYDYEIVFSGDVSYEELRELKSHYSEIGYIVTNAKIVTMSMSISSDINYRNRSVEICVVEIDGSWYIEFEQII